MKVLIASQYFHPERTAAALRLRPLAAGLAARGHVVRVVCEAPSHPEGRLHPGFGERPTERRMLDGFEVTYLRTRVPRGPRARERLASYTSYAALALVAGLRGWRPEVILASSPPLSVGAVGATLATVLRCPWVFDVRDLWPDVAIALGELSANGRTARLATRLERLLYASAAAITVPTDAFVEHLTSTVDRSKIRLLPNGTSASAIRHGSGAGAPASDDGLFRWTYAGNVGLSQRLDAAIEAAAQLGPGFRLQIVGQGASRAHLEQLAAARAPGLVEFSDPVDLDEASRLMRDSSALLVSLADDPTLAATVPVKLYDCCAIGRPVVVAAPGESRRLAAEQGVALAVAPGDAGALATAVSRIRDEPELAGRLAAAGRAFGLANARERQVGPLEALLGEVVGR